MFLKLAARLAEPDETYFMAVSSAEQLAEDVEKSLGKRFDPDLDSLTHT
jgi:zinc finger SWIM domain-containing protein 3